MFACTAVAATHCQLLDHSGGCAVDKAGQKMLLPRADLNELVNKIGDQQLVGAVIVRTPYKSPSSPLLIACSRGRRGDPAVRSNLVT